MDPNYEALSASDGAGEPVRATVQSPGRSIGSTTIPVQATTNWPTGTFIATTGTLLSSGKLDPTTVQVFYGTASGTDITITSFAAGYTDKGNSAGDVVVIKPTTEYANIVAEGILGTTQFPANFANFVEATGGVWSAGVGLVGSGTAGFVWYNGARSAMAAVTNHTFTASKDTYIDYNPASATWTYLPETNGAVEPAVSTGSVRIAKVVTSASAITSVLQTPYQSAVPLRWQYLGYAQITSTFSTTSTTAVQVTGLTATVVVPAGATKVRVTGFSGANSINTAQDVGTLSIWEGVVNSGTQIGAAVQYAPLTNGQFVLNPIAIIPAVPGSVTFNLGLATGSSSDKINIQATTTVPAFILVECC